LSETGTPVAVQSTFTPVAPLMTPTDDSTPSKETKALYPVVGKSFPARRVIEPLTTTPVTVGELAID